MKAFRFSGTVLLVVLNLVLCAGIFAQEEAGSKTFSDYQEMRRFVGELFQQKKYAEAAMVLEDHVARFPGHVRANSYNLALMRTLTGDFDGAVQALLYGIEKGIWYGKFDFNAEIWKPLREYSSFPLFKARNTKLMREASAKAVAELEVRVPDDFDPNREYPLFIALHGGGENIAAFRPQWTSPRLEQEFIVAYPQSSQLIAMNGYNWTEDLEISKNEIRDAYRKVTAEYDIDLDQVIIGGFSSGGVAALEAALADTIPVRGFVVLCPAKPDGFTAERVRAAAGRGLTGTLLTTEMDRRLDQQKEMNALMKAEKLPCVFIVTPDIGHWYPADMPDKLDTSIKRILEDSADKKR
jgi:predicted esterase